MKPFFWPLFLAGVLLAPYLPGALPPLPPPAAALEKSALPRQLTALGETPFCGNLSSNTSHLRPEVIQVIPPQLLFAGPRATTLFFRQEDFFRCPPTTSCTSDLVENGTQVFPAALMWEEVPGGLQISPQSEEGGIYFLLWRLNNSYGEALHGFPLQVKETNAPWQGFWEGEIPLLRALSLCLFALLGCILGVLGTIFIWIVKGVNPEDEAKLEAELA